MQCSSHFNDECFDLQAWPRLDQLNDRVERRSLERVLAVQDVPGPDAGVATAQAVCKMHSGDEA